MGNYGLVPYDEKLIGEISFIIRSGRGKIEFQFVPRILSESNATEWESANMMSVEPLKIHMGGSGRKLNMEWEYLATDEQWTCARIADNLRNLKSYFFEFKTGEYPVAEIEYMTVIPVKINFRMMDLNITYSPEIIFNEGYHPLHTKVNVSLEMATVLNDPSSGKGKLEVNPLKPVEFDWY